MEGRRIFSGGIFLACSGPVVAATKSAATCGGCRGRITDFQSHGIVAGKRGTQSSAKFAHDGPDCVRHICHRGCRCRTQESRVGDAGSQFGQRRIFAGRRIVVTGPVRHEHGRWTNTIESEYVRNNNTAGQYQSLQFSNAARSGCELSQSVSGKAADSAGGYRRIRCARWISIR